MTIGPEVPKALQTEAVDPRLAIPDLAKQIEAGHEQRIAAAASAEATVEADTHDKLAELMKKLPQGAAQPEQRNAA